MEKVLVLGAGVMGNALSIYLANIGHEVNLWGTKWDKEILDEMKTSGKNKLLDMDMPSNISYFYDQELETAFKGVRLIIIAVISKGMESISRMIASYLTEDHTILSITKGIDEKTLRTMSKTIELALSQELKEKLAIVKLGGPIIAKELAMGSYTEGVFASKNLEGAAYAASIFKSPSFRTNISEDIVGVDLCAALKNTYAIAVGIMDGMEKGANNPKAALISRGSIEMAKILEAFDGSKDTVLGPAGVGDYYVTSQGGRNGKFGSLLGQGKTKEQALDAMGHQTVEGIASTLNGYGLLRELEDAGKINIAKDLPLLKAIYEILYEGRGAKEAMDSYWHSK